MAPKRIGSSSSVPAPRVVMGQRVIGSKLLAKSRSAAGPPPTRRQSDVVVESDGGRSMTRAPAKRTMTPDKKKRTRPAPDTSEKLESYGQAIERAMGLQLGGRLSQDVSDYKKESFEQLDRFFKQKHWTGKVKLY